MILLFCAEIWVEREGREAGRFGTRWELAKDPVRSHLVDRGCVLVSRVHRQDSSAGEEVFGVEDDELISSTRKCLPKNLFDGYSEWDLPMADIRKEN